MASATTIDEADRGFMRMALRLACRGLGRTWPNPTVGCVLVRGGQVVGRGWTQPGGRPHAETEALRRAGPAAAGATAYVTLEPCAHHGATGPCAEALLQAGIARAVVAVEDPDPRVAGRGLEMLRQAGIDVASGVCAAEAGELNAGFFLQQQHGRPLVALKLATSLDGRIATGHGESRWITELPAREHGQLLRAQHDGVLIGAGTAVLDDPQLTCRLPGLEGRSPVRIVVDGSLRLPLTSELVRTADQVPTWLVTFSDSDDARRAAYADCGVEVIEVERGPTGLPDLHETLQAFGDRGLTRLLVEGGGRIAASLVRADLVDRVYWYRAPMLLGGDGVPAVQGFGLTSLGKAPRFRRTAVSAIGNDVLETFARAV